MIDFAPTPVGDPVADELLGEYFTSPDLGMPQYHAYRPDPAEFTPPRGEFVVMRRDGTPIGGGGIRMLDPRRAEVKHLWVRETARGGGHGRLLLAELERRAAVLGATEVVLDTNAKLGAAQGLYRSSGYTDVAPYNDNPDATHWFRKELPVLQLRRD